MKRKLDIEATTRALRQAGIDPDESVLRDPNTRRILESLCIRNRIPAVYHEESSP